MQCILQQPLLKNRFCLTQAKFRICAPETTVCLMMRFRKERFATRPCIFIRMPTAFTGYSAQRSAGNQILPGFPITLNAGTNTAAKPRSIC